MSRQPRKSACDTITNGASYVGKATLGLLVYGLQTAAAACTSDPASNSCPPNYLCSKPYTPPACGPIQQTDWSEATNPKTWLIVLTTSTLAGLCLLKCRRPVGNFFANLCDPQGAQQPQQLPAPAVAPGPAEAAPQNRPAPGCVIS